MGSLIGTTIGTTLAAGPTIGQVMLNPQHPAPKSKVTFSVDVTGNTITSVWLWYHECDPQQCFERQNMSMSKTTGNTYTVEVTLTRQETTYIAYHIEVNSSGTWTHNKDVNVTLTTTPTDGTNNNGKKSPGFELLPFVIAIGVIVFISRRKRYE